MSVMRSSRYESYSMLDDKSPCRVARSCGKQAAHIQGQQMHIVVGIAPR